MKLDEETFLTAYLDGELDPGPRRRVDAALLSDPRLADDFRDLAAVRDLISGLADVGTAFDVSDLVVAAIVRRREAGPLGRVIGVRAASWSTRAAALVSAAAALVASASLGVRHGDTHGRPRAVVSRPDALRGRPTLGDSRKLAPDPGAIAARDGVSAPPQGPPAPDAATLLRDRDRQRARALLESPNLRRILVVADVVGSDPGQQVGDLIEKTPRRTPVYGRFTVSQEIVVDPDHPGEATVFAVVMDAQELSHLRSKLNEAFPDSVEESAPRPEAVTRLAQVGQVSVFPGTTVANVFVPSEEPRTALKAATERDADDEFEAVISTLDPLHAPEFFGPVVDPEVPRAKPGPTAGADVPRLREPSGLVGPPAPPAATVVLVWVASPRRPGPVVR